MKVTPLCPTLCHSRDYTVHGILQARILEWVAIPFSRESPSAGIKPRSPGLGLQVDSSPAEPPEKWGGDRKAPHWGPWGMWHPLVTPTPKPSLVSGLIKLRFILSAIL